jgi:hypothetical protein
MLKPCKASLLKASTPILSAIMALTEKECNVCSANRTAEDKSTMNLVVVAGLSGSQNLVLTNKPNNMGILELKFPYSSVPLGRMPTQNAIIPTYL